MRRLSSYGIIKQEYIKGNIFRNQEYKSESEEAVDIHILATSSKGNSYLFQSEKVCILIDVGLSYKVLCQKLEALNISIGDVTHVIITHEHSDHVKGLLQVTKHFQGTLLLREATFYALESKIHTQTQFEFIKDEYEIEHLHIYFYTMSHDAADPIGLRILRKDDTKKEMHGGLVLVTDTGYFNEQYYPHLSNAELYLFESNYDVAMLSANRKYPWSIVRRILSDKGHLSNDDAGRHLKKLIGHTTKHIILCHLSPENNIEDLAYETVKSYLVEFAGTLEVADKLETSKKYTILGRK